MRKSFAERLASNGVRLDFASDNRHSYFVGVLEKVRDYLKPLMKSGVFTAKEESKASDGKPKDAFRNLFEVLDVYSPSEEFLNAPDVVIPPRAETEFTVEEDDTLEEAIFALMALLSDYHLLTDEVKSLWQRYDSGELDVAAVSVATNTAFDLARSMEDEIRSRFSKQGKVSDLIVAYFYALCKSYGINAHKKQMPGDPYNLRAYDLAKHCLVNTTSQLDSYAKGPGLENPVNHYNGKFGWYDEDLGADGETNRDKWDQDYAAMLEILPDLQFMYSNAGRGSRVEDELIRGVGALLEKPDDGVPLWLAWAAQTYLDILQLLGPDCDRPFAQMQQESLKIKRTMLNVPVSSSERHRVLSVATKWDLDPIWTTREKMLAIGLLESRNNPEYKFLRRNPMHCGLLIHNMRATFHTAGAQYAATPGALMVTTQFYHALRNEKLLPEQLAWEDLDTFWKMQGNPTFFVGDPPTNREGYFRNYCLSIGVSASNWAPGKRKGKPNVNTANRRNMKFMGWVSLSMNQRLAPAGERLALSSELIAGILNEGERREAMDGKGHLRPDFKGSNTNASNQVASEQHSPSYVIDKLAMNIHKEIPDLAFDYFTMHNLAWDLLKELKAEFQRIVGVEFLRYVPQEDKLPFVVGYTFSTAAGRGGLRPEEKGEPVDTLMNAAAGVLRKFLEEGRGKVITERAGTEVDPEDVADLEFTGGDLWGIEKLMKKIKEGGGGGPRCPVQ